MQDAILVENVGKRFRRYHAEKPVTFMEAALKGFQRVKPLDELWALRGVSFEVAAGEMIGIIGHNGAGKSTLLQLLGKVAHPNEGRIKMRGRIGALLDLGAGFHGDLTGRENVFVTAIVAGLPRREVARRFHQIVDFAELERFIDNPVRTYSTGMTMRLAFSVAVHTDPQILLVDEFLSVGDLSFQAKCLNRIAEMKEQGCAIVLVSHDVNQVERLCDRALWLKQGTVVAYGEPTVVVGQYTTEMQAKTQQLTPNRPPQLASSGTELRANENRFGSLEAEIQAVRLCPHDEIAAGEAFRIEVDYFASELILDPVVAISITRYEDGQSCLDTHTNDIGLSIEKIQGAGTITLTLDRLDLVQGKYFVNVGLFKAQWEYAYDYHWEAYPLLITRSFFSHGILSPPGQWQIVR